MSIYLFALLFVLFAIEISSGKIEKRELPLSYDCYLNQPGSCQKGDLISTSVADCEKDSFLYTCDPINDLRLSSVVDVPDVSRNGVNCVPVSGLPVRCGSADTRCVCDKAADVKQPLETLANQCRCQYWPAVDSRMNQPSYCTQYDHGGVSGVHFFTCCNNCNDNDQQCTGTTYQGGGSTDNYCGQCGLSSQSGGGRITYRFNCVNCGVQAACRSRCNDEFAGLTKITPGLCPRWAGCFRGCCLEAQERSVRRKRQTNSTQLIGQFCGDLTCQSGENSMNCPVDCCPVTNPSDCNPDTCNPQCCLEPHCCIVDSGNHKTPTNLAFVLVLSTLAAVMYL